MDLHYLIHSPPKSNLTNYIVKIVPDDSKREIIQSISNYSSPALLIISIRVLINTCILFGNKLIRSPFRIITNYFYLPKVWCYFLFCVIVNT